MYHEVSIFTGLTYTGYFHLSAEAEKVAFLLGINAGDLLKGLLKPKIKVGTEFVTQGRNKDQVCYSVSALAKSLYNRMFEWLVKRVNKTLDTKAKRNYFIGVLDIAGFEIFDVSRFSSVIVFVRLYSGFLSPKGLQLCKAVVCNSAFISKQPEQSRSPSYNKKKNTISNCALTQCMDTMQVSISKYALPEEL